MAEHGVRSGEDLGAVCAPTEDALAALVLTLIGSAKGLSDAERLLLRHAGPAPTPEAAAAVAATLDPARRMNLALLLDFKLLSIRRYEYVGQQFNTIGIDLGGWIKQQQAPRRKS